MGLVPGFEHDIFFSYAWDDDRKTAGDSRWVREFVDALRDELHQTPLIRAIQKDADRRVDIFFDEKDLSQDQPLDNELKRKVQSSACLVILMSENYLKNANYCRREREWFYERMQQGGTLNKFGASHYPIFLVRIGPTDRFESYPPELRAGGVGYNFFRNTDDDEPRLCARSIKSILNDKEHGEFLDELGKLARGLAKKFKSAFELSTAKDTLKPVIPANVSTLLPHARPVRAITTAPTHSMVLLSVPSSLDEHTMKLRARLGAERIETVLIGRSDAACEDDIDRLVASARAAVITLELPVNERETTLAHKLFDSARRHNLPTFVGMDPNFLPVVSTLPETRYAAYKRLVAAAAPDPKWFDIPTLTQAILKCLAEPDTDRLNRSPFLPVEIYIDNEREDRQVAEELAYYFTNVVQSILQERAGNQKISLTAYLPAESDLEDPNFNEKRRKRVQRAQGALVVYSGVSEETVVQKTWDILKDTAHRSQFRVAVHDGPPPKGFGFHNNKVRVIKKSDGDAYLAEIVEFVTEVAMTG